MAKNSSPINFQVKTIQINNLKMISNHALINRLDRIAVILVYALFFFSAFSMAAAGGITLLLGAFAAFCLFTYPEWRELKNPLAVPLFAFVFFSLLSTFWMDPFFESIEKLRDFWRFLLPFVIWKCFKTIKQEQLLKFFLIILFLISIYGVIQYFFGVDWLRPEGHKKITPYAPDNVNTGVFHAKGNFSHHLTYSHYLLLVFPVYLSLVSTRTISFKVRIMFLLGSLAIMAGMTLSLGRSAWLGASAAHGILALQLPKKWLIGIGGLTATGALLLLPILQIGSSFTTYQQKIESPLKARMDSLFTLRHHRDRFFLWESAMLAIQDHFWFGIGFDNDAEVMQPYRQTVGEKYQHVQFTNQASAGVHNIYLQTFLNSGAVGLLCYLWLWGTLLGWNIRWIRHAKDDFPFEKSLLWGISAGFTGFLIAGIFENSFRDGEVQTILFTLMGWSLHLGFQIKNRGENR
ncbi:MAG: O-antigen ligase family protein [SAR324 cluster bacterium]|nr:O-antigen ligase family protein [SAR324 cluster bacterium]